MGQGTSFFKVMRPKLVNSGMLPEQVARDNPQVFGEMPTESLAPQPLRQAQQSQNTQPMGKRRPRRARALISGSAQGVQ